ncbi:SH3 domain-containing protein Dlish-like [Watersipora subatra]|uniref:SH3 domain-containing protein Dlish-like n=1 Tax=Watersipora subatra TaxID=2589382 RepID=UPI00355AF0BA
MHQETRARDDSVNRILPTTDLSSDRLTMMVVKHSFVPDGPDELQVEAGQIVYATHEENQWVYALTESGEHGFVPSNFLTSVDRKRVKKIQQENKSPRHIQRPKHTEVVEEVERQEVDSDNEIDGASTSKLAKSLSFGEIELGDFDVFGYISDASFTRSDSEKSLNGSDYSGLVESFVRKPAGKYLVLHNFHGEDENDATIFKGDCVTVLNKDDHDWYYIQASNGTEGFVPRSYLWQATWAPDDDVII